MQTALGTQAEIESIREAAQKLDDKSLSYFYIKALEKLGEGPSAKFIFPLELTRLVQDLADRTKNIHSQKKLDSVFEEYAPYIAAYLETKKAAKKKKRRK
jgi:hypothetical protein